MRHTNIVEVVAFSIGEGLHPPCLVMERMDESLYEILSLLTINFPSALGIIQDVCEVGERLVRWLLVGGGLHFEACPLP